MSLNFILGALGRQLRNSVRDNNKLSFFLQKKILLSVAWEIGYLESKRERRKTSQEALAEVEGER